jgi:AraC-like DNA-binding protein
MHYTECASAPPLRETIRCYWFLVGASGGGDPAFPDGSPELIVNLADPFVAIAPDGAERVQPRCFLVGQISRPFHVRPTGRVELVGVRLEAGGTTWLVDDICALTDTFADLGGTLDGALDRLVAALAAAPGVDARVRVLDAALTPLVVGGRKPDWRVRDSVRVIRDGRGLTDIAELAAGLRTTPRSLQRLFARDVGLSPKQLSRIVRFQQVFAAWREDPTSLSRVAAQCGYFDHSHLVRDFRELAGVSPAQFLPDQPEFTRFFLPG